MKNINDIIADAQALATIGEDQFEAAVATHVADLQAFAALPVTPVADPIMTVVITTKAGIVTSVTVPEQGVQASTDAQATGSDQEPVEGGVCTLPDGTEGTWQALGDKGELECAPANV